MRWKKRFGLLVLGMAACLVSGCESTPEEPVVREKGADSLRAYESAADGAGRFLREELSVPEHVADRAVFEDGRLVIDTDADVFCPDVKTVSTYEVSAGEGGQKLMDLVTGVFFPDAKFYRRDEYVLLTEEKCLAKLTELRKYRSEGNLDPYGFGKDESGAYVFDLDKRIAQYEDVLRDAPKEKPLEEVWPSFGLQYVTYDDDGNPEKEVAETLFYGTAVTEDGTYEYCISSAGPDMEFTIEKDRREELADWLEPVYWATGEDLTSGQEETDGRWSEADVKKFVRISFEDAKKTAEEKVKKLGMDLKVYGWDYDLVYRGNDTIRESSILDGGYIFYFTRELDGVPITHTAVWGGGVEEMESTLEPWRYERCNIVVAGGGICRVELQNPYEIGEVQVEHVKLLDFESILKIYKQMMEVSYADLPSDEKLRTYHIRRITLGYGRIYDPTVNNAAGVLVPVWDFFGGFDLETDDRAFLNSGDRSTRSFLTLNAVDGTVIDRELGY